MIRAVRGKGAPGTGKNSQDVGAMTYVNARAVRPRKRPPGGEMPVSVDRGR